MELPYVNNSLQFGRIKTWIAFMACYHNVIVVNIVGFLYKISHTCVWLPFFSFLLPGFK